MCTVLCMACVRHVSSEYGLCTVLCMACVRYVFSVSQVPSERGQGAGAGPGVLGQGEVGEGAELQAPGQGPQLVALQVQGLDRRHAGERTV